MLVAVAASLVCFVFVSLAIILRRDLSFGATSRSDTTISGWAVEAAYWSGLVLYVVTAGIAFSQHEASKQALVVIPKDVQDAIELGLQTGVIAPREASEINDWLNRSVRSTRRSLEVIPIDHEYGVPRAILEKARDGQELSLDERNAVLKWLVAAEDAGVKDVVEVLFDVIQGPKLTELQKRSIGAWLLHGPSNQRQLTPGGWREPFLWGASPNESPDIVPMPPAP